jgi:tetratricopeptide (TPR) repeat protein
MPPPPPPDVRNAARNVVRVTPPRRPQSVRPPVATEPLILKTRTKKRASTMPPPPRNQDLFATLKELRAMAKDERSAESFRQLGILFGTVAFGACRPEDRRRALRLLVFSKLQASTEEERTRAHHAALPALQLLVVEHHDPADYEMLGMAYVALGDTEKALDVFKKALAIERKRNAQSPLGDNLQKRVRALAAATMI